MKINFLTEPLSDLTGGIIYDHQLYDILVQRFGRDVNLIDDNFFGEEYIDINPNYKRFQKIYRKNVDYLFDCDYLFVNSRLYTRFVNYIWFKIKTKNCKIIEIHHHFNFETHIGIKRIVHKKYEMDFINRAYKLISPNPYTIDKLNDFGFTNIKKLEAFEVKYTIKYNKKGSRKKQILFIGSVEDRKGLTYGIKAFSEFCKHVNDYEYLIAGKVKGGDEYLLQLNRLCTELNIENKVKFLGRVSDQEKDSLLKESEVFLFPSQNEGYGLVMIEAMSYGVPVIAFNNTAMPYTVNNDNGYIIENKNVKEMADALVEICTNKEVYERKRIGALKTVSNLPSEEAVLLQYNMFMNELVEDMP